MIKVRSIIYSFAIFAITVFIICFMGTCQVHAATAPSLSLSEKNVLAGESFDVKINNAGKAKIASLKSSNTRIATVTKVSNSKFKTKAVSAGTAKISLKAGSSNLSYTVHVFPAVSFSSVKSELALGESVFLSVNGGFPGDSAIITSSNQSVVSVTKTGNRKASLKALKAGSVKITAKCSGKSKTFTVNVKVKIAVAKSHSGGDTSQIVSMLRSCGAKAEIVTANVNVGNFNGLVLPGGTDINPKLYGETNAKRQSKGINDGDDRLQMEVARKFIQAKKPVMGICRGCQLLNVYFKGTLNQNISGHRRSNGIGVSHAISISRDSVLYKIFGKTSMTVNSFHHQSVKRLGSGLKITAKHKDGTVEAIEHTSLPVIGFQWHPEMSGAKGKKVFKYFISMCQS